MAYTHTAPNIGLEPTAYSFGFAYASRSGSGLAFGFNRKTKGSRRLMRGDDYVVPS